MAIDPVTLTVLGNAFVNVCREMGVTMTRSAGMLVLAIYLIVIGLAGLVHLAIPLAVTALLALLAGVLILVGR